MEIKDSQLQKAMMEIPLVTSLKTNISITTCLSGWRVGRVGVIDP